jgi:hypothetical protein
MRISQIYTDYDTRAKLFVVRENDLKNIELEDKSERAYPSFF